MQDFDIACFFANYSTSNFKIAIWLKNFFQTNKMFEYVLKMNNLIRYLQEKTGIFQNVVFMRVKAGLFRNSF